MAVNRKAQAEKKTDPIDPFARTSRESIVEVFCFKGDRIAKTPPMRYDEFISMKRHKGWRYQAFEPGFCSIKPTE